MFARRIDKVNEELTRELSSLLRSMKDPRMGRGMVSVVRIETASDFRYAKVYISVLGSLEEETGVFSALRSASGFLRRELAAAMDLRYTPELRFERDRSMIRGTEVLGVLNQIKIPSVSEEDKT